MILCSLSYTLFSQIDNTIQSNNCDTLFLKNREVQLAEILSMDKEKIRIRKCTVTQATQIAQLSLSLINRIGYAEGAEVTPKRRAHYFDAGLTHDSQ